MRIEQQFSEPEHVKDRSAYRVRIEGKDGKAIEIVEQFDGGFRIVGCLRDITVQPLTKDSIIVRVGKP